MENKTMTETAQIASKVQTKLDGKIIKIDSSGWGFIISEEVKFVKFFFHWTGLAQGSRRFPELKTGMKVKFIPLNLNETAVEGEKAKGPKAIQIEVLD